VQIWVKVTPSFSLPRPKACLVLLLPFRVLGIQFREIQQSQLLATNSLSNLLYRAKVTKALLHRLIGDMEGFGE
jgi:hypothetical protein